MPITIRGSTSSSLRLGTGNVSNPSLSFANAPNTGFYLTQGNIGFSVAGVEKARVTPSGLVVSGNVSAANFVINGSTIVGAATTLVSNVQVANSTYSVLDDTAVSTDGGYIVMNGSGFIGGSMVLVDGTPATSTTVLGYTQLGAAVQPKAAGTYSVTVVRPDSVSVNVPLGITYSSFPAWSTSTDLGNVTQNTAFTRTLAATSDSNVTYANTSALPPQTTLASNGTLSGNITTGVLGTTYSFEVKATDMETQEALRTFSLYLTPSIYNISGSTYDATILGPQTSITDLEIYSSLLPSSGYLKYTLKRSGGAGSNVTVVSYFVKNGTQLCQSIFHMDSYSLETPIAHPSLNYAIDDHDTLGMQGDGTGFLARTNTDTWNRKFDRFRGSSASIQDGSFDQCFMYSQSGYIVGSNAILIAFPGSNTNVWFNLSTSTYKVNDFASQTLPSAIVSTLGVSTISNRVWHLSDGVNCCMIGTHTNSTAHYIEFDLNTGTIYKTNTFSITVPNTNSTEEDSNGCQLFAVNGCWAWYADLNFYWTAKNTSTAYGWRFVSSRGSSTSNSIGSVNTQTQADIMSSIDATDNRVWFADWGHDDGGLFNVGNDFNLGIAKSSIYLLTSNQIL